MKLSEEVLIRRLGETEHSFVVETIGRLRGMPMPGRLEAAKQLRPLLHLIIADGLSSSPEDAPREAIPEERTRGLRIES